MYGRVMTLNKCAQLQMDDLTTHDSRTTKSKNGKTYPSYIKHQMWTLQYADECKLDKTKDVHEKNMNPNMAFYWKQHLREIKRTTSLLNDSQVFDS